MSQEHLPTESLIGTNHGILPQALAPPHVNHSSRIPQHVGLDSEVSLLQHQPFTPLVNLTNMGGQ